jgi:hypothetical protein
VCFEQLQEVLHMDRKREEWRVGDFKIAYDEIWGLGVKNYDDDEPEPARKFPAEQGKDHKFEPKTADLLGRVELWEVAKVGQERKIWERLDKRIHKFIKTHKWAFPRAEKAKDLGPDLLL